MATILFTSMGDFFFLLSDKKLKKEKEKDIDI